MKSDRLKVTKTLSMIAIMASNRIIGKGNQLPWHHKADLQYFKETTMGCPIIMGRKTRQSIGRNLPGRENIVVTSAKNYQSEGAVIFNSIQAAIDYAETLPSKEIFIIGGATLYEACLPYAHNLYLTVLHKEYDGDTYFPQFNKSKWLEVKREDFKADEHSPCDYSFIKLIRNQN